MILTPNQMAKAENYAVSKGTSLAMLMENSGYELSKAIKNYAYKYFKKKVLILCGNGNNGGDGFVCANHLSNFGLEVSVALICGLPKTELSINAFKGLTKDITITTSDFNSLIFDADIIADCVFGTGFHGDLSAETVEIFKMVSNSKAYKFACDIPSGINCLTGVVSKGTISCDKTITFHGLKLGAIFNNSKGFCGDISISDIGI
ncbi:MAG: NAD(P)H-hydrate epimerase, partial [Clostridiales bacterium]|nr:NAD(P)H-hydrate epimerase [Clostridiales bacterium]